MVLIIVAVKDNSQEEEDLGPLPEVEVTRQVDIQKIEGDPLSRHVYRGKNQQANKALKVGLQLALGHWKVKEQ